MLIVDRTGAFVLTWLGFRANLQGGGEPYDLAVYVARAKPGEPRRFDPPREVTAGLIAGRPWIVFDKPWAAALEDGSIAVSYRFQAAESAGIYVSRSHDGEHFQHAIVAKDTSFGGTLATICAAPSGERLWVAYVDARRSVWATVVLHASEDGGATWPAEHRVTVTQPEDRAVVEAPWCASDGKTLAVAFGVTSKPPDSGRSAIYDAIVVLQSDDGGATFPRRFEYREAGAVMMHPTLARLPDGDIEIVYQAGKGDGEIGDIRIVRLSPKGAPRGPSEVLRRGVKLVTRRDPARGWTGDFMGLAARGNERLLALGDNADGAPHVIFRHLGEQGSPPPLGCKPGPLGTICTGSLGDKDRVLW
jgi:hypothetical protein